VREFGVHILVKVNLHLGLLGSVVEFNLRREQHERARTESKFSCFSLGGVVLVRVDYDLQFFRKSRDLVSGVKNLADDCEGGLQ